jgi:hypothetical protein
MARATYDSLKTAGNSTNFHSNTAKSLATIASGKNADGTDFSIPHVAATATAVASGTTDVAGVAAGTGLRLLGYSIHESASSAAVATVIIRNGTSNAGGMLAAEEIAADGAVTRWFGPNGIAAAAGIWIDRVAGETELVIYHTTIT